MMLSEVMSYSNSGARFVLLLESSQCQSNESAEKLEARFGLASDVL